MGVLCSTTQKKRKQIMKKEQNINDSKQKTQRLITKIEAQIQVLINEIKDLNYKVKTDDGNITNQEKQELKNDLYEKVKKCKKLYINRRTLKTNLAKIDDLERDKEVDNVLEGNNKVFEEYPGDDQVIDNNMNLVEELENASDIRYEKMKGNQDIIDGKKSQFEKDQEIDNFMKELLI
jgi:hypothetical protein